MAVSPVLLVAFERYSRRFVFDCEASPKIEGGDRCAGREVSARNDVAEGRRRRRRLRTRRIEVGVQRTAVEGQVGTESAIVTCVREENDVRSDAN